MADMIALSWENALENRAMLAMQTIHQASADIQMTT